MITDEIMEAIEQLMGSCENEEQRRGMQAVKNMLAEFDEDVWDAASNNKNWLRSFLHDAVEGLPIKVTNIDWDTENATGDLPTEFSMTSTDLIRDGYAYSDMPIGNYDGPIASYLRDRFGYPVLSFGFSIG